jgi:hypothetical protein
MADIVIKEDMREAVIYVLNAASAHAEYQLVAAESMYNKEAIGHWRDRLDEIGRLWDEVNK